MGVVARQRATVRIDNEMKDERLNREAMKRKRKDMIAIARGPSKYTSDAIVVKRSIGIHGYNKMAISESLLVGRTKW